ncbi:MAG: hypothetical protein ACFFE5_11255 [Candidatus Thorarchaeota archaeon]
MIYNNPEDSISEYEETINKLTEQITELFSKIHFYQALVAEKESIISQLVIENNQLKAQIQDLSNEFISPPPSNQESYTPPPPPLPISTPETSSTPTLTEPRVNKRQCPKCGATGFAIREIDDKSNIISYVPNRIYAKKKSCTKCRYEW